jgi:multidrug efflux pump subunit AcrA (membrane-fusion protein)
MSKTRRSQPNALVRLATRVGLGVLMLAVAGGLYFALYSTRPQVETVDPEQARPIANVFRVEPVEVQHQWLGYGTAEPLVSADVPARVTATVESIPDDIEPGRTVTAGQILVRLDPSDFERQLEIAQQRIAEIDAALAQLEIEQARLRESLELEDADVALAQTEYDRQLEFRQRDVNNPQDVDNAQRILINAQRARLQTRQALDLIEPRRQSLQAQRASQQSQVQIAELNRKRTTIVSPIDGVIQSLAVEVGENLTAGQPEPVARVVALDRIEVPLALPASARGDVRVGDRVLLEPTGAGLTAAAPSGWTTQVDRIAPEADATTRTFTVFAVIDTQDGESSPPQPGAFLRGRVFVNQVEPRLIVPRSAIRAGRLQVVEDDVLISRSVEVDFHVVGRFPRFGLAEDQWAVLAEGVVEPGALVLANAATRRADGTAVQTRRPGGLHEDATASDPASESAEPKALEKPLPGAEGAT